MKGNEAFIIEELVQAKPDVVVLNEVGFDQRDFVRARRRLKDLGYRVLCCDTSYPTAVAVLQENFHVIDHRDIPLDSDRHAMEVTLRMRNGSIDKSAVGDTCDDDDRPSLKLFGLHLECSDSDGGEIRLGEMKTLLHEVPDSDSETIMIIGDFNQQREQDYLESEWKSILINKSYRKSPSCDGVAPHLQSQGYSCIWDRPSQNVLTNWPVDQPPPSTHWSGTIVDYTYFKGKHWNLQGVYVSPCPASDHRLIVCDWAINTAR